MASVDGDEIKFSTGKTIYANCGYVGISFDDEYGYSVSEGYDGGIADNELTRAERMELADLMIGLWSDYKKSQTEPKPISTEAEGE